MDSIPASCRIFLDILRDLIAGARAEASLLGERPARAPRIMAQKLAAGLRMVEACLRNLLLAMALEFEHGLVEARRPLGRPHKRKVLIRKRRLKVLNARFNPLAKNAMKSFEALKALGQGQKAKTPRTAPQLVDMHRLNQRLDQLSAIVADPVGRARRLAYHLARNRPGPIHPPDTTLRPPGHLCQYWRTEASITFSALAFEIQTKSRARPPPLPPRRWHGPSINVLG
jgi:hypothetical protein